MKRQDDFIKNKLASLDAANVDDEKSAPHSLREKYPALCARFEERDSERKKTRNSKSRAKNATVAGLCGVAACAVIAVAVILPMAFNNDDKDYSSAPAPSQLYSSPLSFDALAQSYDVLVPLVRNDFTCIEYKYRRTQKTALVTYTVENFTVDIVIDPDYEYEKHIFDRATIEQSAPLFDYRYAELQSNTIAVWEYGNYTYYAEMKNAAQEQLHATLCSLETV